MEVSRIKQHAVEFYDGRVIGGGPAGLTAAIYLARAKYRVMVIEKEKIGGQITITSEVVNYPGLLRTDGTHLTENMRKQAEYFGAEFQLAEVKDLALDGNMKSVVTDKGTFRGLGLILATVRNDTRTAHNCITHPHAAAGQGSGVLCHLRRRVFYGNGCICNRWRFRCGGGIHFPDEIRQKSISYGSWKRV